MGSDPWILFTRSKLAYNFPNDFNPLAVWMNQETNLCGFINLYLQKKLFWCVMRWFFDSFTWFVPSFVTPMALLIEQLQALLIHWSLGCKLRRSFPSHLASPFHFKFVMISFLFQELDFSAVTMGRDTISQPFSKVDGPLILKISSFLLSNSYSLYHREMED